MTERKEAVRAWAVLGATLKGEAYSLEKATIYPLGTDRGWLERTFPGRVVPVEISPLSGEGKQEAGK